MILHIIYIVLLVVNVYLSEHTAAAISKVTPFTPTQEKRISEVANEYFMLHPEVLVKLNQKVQSYQNEQKLKSISTSVIKNREYLLNDKNTPSYGPIDSKVTVVEFFDYQCIYCYRLAPELEKIIKANPEVHFVFKEWPIFASRWENSGIAAKTGLQIWKQKGGEAYLKYHNAIYDTEHNEGKLTSNDINRAAKSVNFDINRASDVQGTLDSINALAQQLGLSGTPALVVMPSEDGIDDNVTVIPGFMDEKGIQSIIDQTTKKLKNQDLSVSV